MGRRIPASLPVWEQAFYWMTFISAIIYGVYNVYLTSQETRDELHYLINSTGFMQEYSDVKDVGSGEWFAYENHSLKVLPPILLLHIVVACAIQYLSFPPKAKMCVHITMGALCILYLQSWMFLLLLLLTPLPFYFACLLPWTHAVWVVFFGFVIAMVDVDTSIYIQAFDIKTFGQFHEVFAVYAFLLFRCLFCALERTWSLKEEAFKSSQQQLSGSSTKKEETAPSEKSVNDKKDDKGDDNQKEQSSSLRQRKRDLSTKTAGHTADLPPDANSSLSGTNGKTPSENAEKCLYDWPVMTKVPSLLDMYFYVFYVPVLMIGPPVPYKTFMEQFEKPVALTSERVFGAVWKLTRICFWIGFNHVVLHFLFFNALNKDSQVMEETNKWTLATVAYLTGQWMTNKYVAIYGVMTEVAKFDGLDLPRHPSCISYIYLYSDMWRSFDRGLGSCMKRYVFIPLKGSDSGFLRSEFASLASFFLVGLWQGGSHTKLLWCALNFIEVNIEVLGAYLEKTDTVQKHLMSKMSPSWDRRLRGALSYPLFLLGTTSNMYFMVGGNFGGVYAMRICLQLDSFLTLGLIAFSGIQVSNHLERLGHTTFS